jgi:hypothetical protein
MAGAVRHWDGAALTTTGNKRPRLVPWHIGEEEMTASATGDASSIAEADIVTFVPHLRTGAEPSQEPHICGRPRARFAKRLLRINSKFRELQ